MIDFDHVEPANLGPQAYRETDVGRSKVEATAELSRQLNPGLSVEPIAERFARHLQLTPVVFCCVDSITTRRHIWNALQDRVECYIDGRMAAEVLRIITVIDAVARHSYPETLFQEHEALRETCTARSTIYCANVAAGLSDTPLSHTDVIAISDAAQPQMAYTIERFLALAHEALPEVNR